MQNDSPSSLAKDAWFEPEMFHPLPHDRIVAEADRFEQVQGSLEEKWEVESEKYETIMTISWNGESLDVPRRNYLNEKGTVQDCSIFPYHTSLYPLMDAYDCIYDEEDDDDRNTTAVVRIDHNGGEIVPLHPIASNAVRHSPAVTLSQRRSTIHGAVPQQVPGFMPCTENSILKTLLREIDPMNHAGDSTDFWSVLYAESERHCQAVHSNLGATIAQLSTGQDQLDGFFEYINRNQVFLDSGKQPKVVDPSPYDVLEQLPRVREERIPILLSLLRHALSDLQKDYKLAAAALVLMNQYGDLNDTTMFRQILVILAAEFVCCYRPCSVLDDEEDSAPDHYCSEWHHFHYKIWNAVFCFNLVRITEAHAICIVGFIRSIFTKQFGAVSMTVNNSNSSCHSSESVENKRKHLLKREVATRRAEEEEKEEARGDIAGDIPVQFVERLIFMLGERATQDRKLLSKDTDNLAFAYRKESFLNCLRALTSIAELSAHFLPDYERFTNLTSTIVLSLCRCLVKEDFYNMDLAHDTNYLGQLQFFRGRSLMSPLRYCNRITDPIRRQKIPHDEFKPPIAILDAVRGLFVKNLVDVEHAGLAYGDFVLWCGYDVLPLDPFLFWIEYSFPCFEEDSDEEYNDDDDDSGGPDDRPTDWDRDEHDRILSIDRLRARNDFSLLLLQRAWQAPWSPGSHDLFSLGFRDAVKSVALCTHRLDFPNDTMVTICSFLRRDWWEDDREQCWNFECQFEQLSKTVERRVSGQSKPSKPKPTFTHCPQCHVATYCSKDCRDNDFKMCHKKLCGRPPMISLPPTKDEISFCNEALGGAGLPYFMKARSASAASMDMNPKSSLVERNFNEPSIDEANNMENESADDDGSWETVDSADDTQEQDNVEADGTLTSNIIYKYFKSNAYDT